MSPNVIDAMSACHAVFHGIGQLFFADNPWSGMIIMAGIIVCPRIVEVFALTGSIVGMLTGVVVGANYHGLWGFNSFDGALAIGGVFYVLTWRSALFATACVIATALLCGAIGVLFTPLAPAGADAVVLFRDAGRRPRERASPRLTPVPVAEISTPEEHLARLPVAASAGPSGDTTGVIP